MVTAYLIVTKVEIGTIGMPEGLLPALVGASVVLIAAQFIIAKFLADDRLFPRIHKMMASEPSAGIVNQDQQAQILLSIHLNYGIFLWALGAFPTFFGLLLTILSDDMRFVLGFIVYSILNMFHYRPQRNKYENQMTRLNRYLETRN